jgi:ligand-binding sensor domain-containing protein
MSTDLPVLRAPESDLPALVTPPAAVEEPAPGTHEGWATFAATNEVRGLAVSAAGEVWLATAGGAVRWRSGERFTRYGSEHGLCGNALAGVAVDGEGRPWVLDARGAVSFLDAQRWRAFALDALVSCLEVDNDGGVWLGTPTGLLRVGAGPVPDVDLRLPFAGADLDGEPPRRIAVTDAARPWMCGPRGLFEWEDDGRWRRRSHRSGILALCASGGVLWLGTVDGLFGVDLDDGSVTRYLGRPTTALAPAPGGVWAATPGEIGRLLDGNWTPAADKLPGLVTALAALDTDDICVATESGLWQGGLERFRPWSTQAPPDATGSDGTFGGLVQALATATEDREAIVWAGTATGLFALRPDTRGCRQMAERRLRDVSALTADDDRLYVGSWHAGLRVVRDGRLDKATILAEPVIAVAHGARGEPSYAATPEAIFEIDPREREGPGVRRLLDAEELSHEAVPQALCVSVGGRIWIGTSGGLFLFTRDSGPRLIRGELTGADVRALLGDPEEPTDMFIATARGLYHGTDENWFAVGPLRDAEITALVADPARRTVWVGTAGGLIRLVRDQEGWAPVDRFDCATSGLAGDRVSALAVDADGRLWAGSQSGLSSYESGDE